MMIDLAFIFARVVAVVDRTLDQLVSMNGVKVVDERSRFEPVE